MTIGERIKFLRSKNDMTLEDVGNIVGVGKSTVRKWESGEIANMRRDKIAKLAAALHTTPAYLMGWGEETSPAESSNVLQFPNIEALPKMKQIPLLGVIACGEPILAEENFDGMVQVPAGIDADYALRCKGDSMINARIMDGDLVFVRQQPDVENGEIAAVLIDDEATLKRVYKHPDNIVLQPENPKYSPFVYTGTQLQDVRIIGKAVYFMSKVR